MGFPATTRHYSCISLLMLIVVVTTGANETSTIEPTTDIISFMATTLPVTTDTNETSTIEPTTDISFIATTLTPLRPPEDVVLNAVSTISFSVEWTEVTADDVTYDITVSFSNDTFDEDIQNTTSPTVIDDKTPGQTYDVNVTAVRGQESVDSAPKSITLSPSAVINLEEVADETDSNTVTASWEKGVGIVTGYRVNCSEGTVNPPSDLSPDETSASCTGDIAGENVTVTVTALSGADESVPAMVYIVANPNPVESLAEKDATTDSVTVEWNRPSSGLVDGYLVNCSSGTSEMIGADTDPSEYMCSTNDIAGGVIVVTVQSISNSKYSIPGTVNITADPNPVDVLFEIDATTDSVTAGWLGPTMGVFDGYELSCSAGTTVKTSLSSDTTQGTCSTTEAGQVIVVSVSSTSDNKTSAVKSISITALPDAVADLQETGATTTSVTVGWSTPNGTVDSYMVECTNGAAPPSSIIGSDSVEASCENVTSGSEVTVSISSKSGNKSTPAEQPVRALPNAVNNLQGSGATTSNVSVTWDRPMGELDQYDVYCLADTTGSTNDTVIDNSDSLGYTCLEITAGDVVTVTVVTVSGDKNNSDSTVVRAQPNAVSNLKEVSEDTMSVTAAWDEPVGIVSHYIVECSSGNPQEANVTDDSDSTNFTASCVGLPTPGADYTMNVTSFSYGVSGASKTVTITAQPSKPKLSSTGSTEDSITVEWEWDTPTDGEVDYFQIQCENGTASDSTLEYVGDNVSYQVNCTGLPVSGGLYSVTVSSVSENKTSDPAEITVTATPTGVDLSALRSTVSQVGASWLQPSGKVDMFEVECSGDAVPAKDSILYDKSAATYEAFCNVTTPGAPYNLTVTSERANQSASARINLRASPESVENFSVLGDYTTTRANLEWAVKEKCENKTGCVWDRYLITYSGAGSDENGSRNGTKDAVTVTFDNLVPGDLYNFSITVFSYEQESSVKEDSQRMRPAEATGLAFSPESRLIIANWARPDVGFVTGYDVTIRETDSEDTLESQEVTGTTATFEKLTPGVSYTVRVCSRSVKQSCIVGVLSSVTTIEEPPTEPRNFTVGIFSNTAVVVEFLPPAKPNGIITSYTITYTGTGDGGEDEGSRSVSADEQTESGIYKTTIGELRSGYTYNFRVTASNSAGVGDAAGPVEQTLEERPPDVPDTPVAPPPESDRGVKSFDFTFSSDLFSDCNGQLKTFSVLVIPNSMYKGNDDNYEETSGSEDPNTPAHNEAKGGEYKAISRVTWPFPPDYSCGSGSGKRRRRSEVIQGIKVTIGNGSTYDGGFTNVALRGGTGYHVKIRAWNDAGYSESPYSEEITTASNPIAWIIPLVIILLILVVVAGVFVWRERQKPGKVTHFLKSRTSNKANGGIDNHAFDNDRPMRRTGDDRPVRLGEFAAHLEEMSKDADYLFSEEYSDLRPIGKNQASKAAELNENKVKNRFSNILPYDHTRVNLEPSADEPGSDYINANYMIGYDSPREYIACQGPLQNTEEDMWRMVWEQGASLIVMVTQLMEKGKIKCHQYWPEEGEGPVQYGEITVRPLGKELTDLWVIRKFIISRGPTTRKVTHFNFIGWPDHGVPDKPEDLIQFVQSVRACKQNDGKPVVVHCSAGVGRTGTFISLDTLMTTMEQEDEVDIFGLVRKMRMNRCAMVQTETQYIFIHECINALLEGASEVIYENQNGTPTEENIYYNEALI